jgi:nucleoside diphosphate kinase
VAVTIDWTRFGFVLLQTDAVLRHLARPIVERLLEEPCSLRKFKVTRMESRELDSIYQVNIDFVWDTYRYRLVDQALELGPVLVLLIEHRDASGGNGHEALRRLKGRSDPYEAEPGSIRADFESVNSILSLIHSSDSTQDAEREGPIFFGDTLDDEPGSGPDEIWNACRLLEARRPRERRGFDEVLGGLRARMAAALWHELKPAGRELVASRAVAGPAALAETGLGALLAQELGSSAHPLAEVLACEFQPGFPSVRADPTWRLLDAFGVTTDPWEHVVLATSTHFRPWRSGGSNGR